MAGPPSPEKPQRAIARHRGDDPVWGDLADAVVDQVRDEQVARAVHRHAARTVQLRAGGRPAIAGKAGSAIARHRGDDPAWGDLADAVVVRSAMNRLPAPSTATPAGDSVARWWPARHRRSSLHAPLPATVVMIPLGETLRTTVETPR